MNVLRGKVVLKETSVGIPTSTRVMRPAARDGCSARVSGVSTLERRAAHVNEVFMPDDANAALESAALAGRVRSALESGDLDGIRDLLDPGARWGAPEGPSGADCRNRDQVIAWWASARAAGARRGRSQGPTSAVRSARMTRLPGGPGERSLKGQVGPKDTDSAACDHRGELVARLTKEVAGTRSCRKDRLSSTGAHLSCYR
jgi:hypothetical protein